MDNQLKQLLLKIAALRIGDQRWLLKQLTPQQKRMFSYHKGTSLLYEARRFANLPLPTNQPSKPCLPDLCSELKNQSPLFVAIILEQGRFSWENKFLAEYPLSLPIDLVNELKAATKSTLFHQWQKTLNFAEQLEVENGSNI
jgi:hypothetical protein